MTPTTAALIPVAILATTTVLVVVGLWRTRQRERPEMSAREMQLARLDHGAESLAVNARMWAESADDVASRIWRDGADWYIDNINERFDAIVAGLPRTADDPFESGYWPVVSAPPAPATTLLDRLSAFAPEATLEIILERNDVPTVFSWTTQEYATVPAPARVTHHARTRVRSHRRHRR